MSIIVEDYWNGPGGENSKFKKKIQSHYAGPISIPGPSTCDFCWRKSGWVKFFTDYFLFSRYHSTNAPYSKFVHIPPAIEAITLAIHSVFK